MLELHISKDTDMARKGWMNERMRGVTYRKSVMALVLSFSLCVTTGAAGQCAQADQTNDDREVVHRVVEQSNEGLLRYHMEDAGGQEVTLPEQSGGQTSSYRKEVQLPSSYDPRGTENETPIRNQTDTRACWAFGALKSLETDCIKQGTLAVQDADLSESHLAWFAWTPLQDTSSPLYGDNMVLSGSQNPYNIGGNALLATFTLANKWGAVAEEKAPFGKASSMRESMLSADASLRTQSEIQLTQSECYDPDVTDPTNEEDRNAIKQAILEHGAMDVSLYYTTSFAAMKENTDGSYALYSNTHGQEDANHCVTIVGWDDSYDQFRRTPEAPGAWLIANSYGTSSNEQGYFWVSYYDTSLGEFYSFQGVDADTYTTLFQYDGMGWSGYISSSDTIKLANVFTTETAQKLEAVSFYTVMKDQPYQISIYRNVHGDDPEQGVEMDESSVSGTLAQSGYHTISLPSAVCVGSGETFSVVVTYGVSGDIAAVPFEGESDPRSGISFHSKSGQSYCYFAEDGDWDDTTALEINDATYNMNNVCIKVFGNPTTDDEVPVVTTPPTAAPSSSPQAGATADPDSSSKATAVPSGSPQTSTTPNTNNGSTGSNVSRQSQTVVISCKKSYTLGKGERLQLPVSPVTVNGKTLVTFSSTRTKVAKVNAKGVVTAKKKGKAVITIRAGGKKYKAKIQVKKAPSSVKLRATKTTLKKGKTAKVVCKLPAGTASYRIKYRSSNKKIIVVDQNGKLKAKRSGTAKITVQTYNGKRASLKIRVK